MLPEFFLSAWGTHAILKSGGRGVIRSLLAALLPISCKIFSFTGSSNRFSPESMASCTPGKVVREMYTGPMLDALRLEYPAKRALRVLEDNDPAGFKSKKGENAKKESKIHVFEIPKRSPQLNICDYALRSEVSRRMRDQEKRWPKSKKETRKVYLARLRRIALRLPSTFVSKSIGDMKRRCELLEKARGRHFEE